MSDFIKEWNEKYPLDRWYRRKYKIPFNSPNHRLVRMIDIVRDFQEDVLYNNLNNKDIYTPGSGDWLRKREVIEDQSLIDKGFDDLDISQL